MDVPAANCVIRFDPMLNSVSFVQGRGRARQADSSFVVLSERADRTVAMLAGVEQQQLEIVRNFQPLPPAQGNEKERTAQLSREANARLVLKEGLTLNTAIADRSVECRERRLGHCCVSSLPGFC